MKYLLCFLSAFFIYKSSFISTNIIPPRNEASKRLLKEKLENNPFVLNALKEKLRGTLRGLENNDISYDFAKRPRGGNDDPTV